MKVKYLKLGIVFFWIFTLIFFLEVCPPLDRLSFNWWVLGLCIFSFFYGLLAKDYSIVGLYLPVANGFARLSPHFYPVSSLMSLLTLLGFILTKKFDQKIIQTYRDYKTTIWIAVSFFIINLLATFWSFLYLNYPGIVYAVNVKGELSFHMTFHVVGYFFLPFIVSASVFLINLFFKDEKVVNNILVYLTVGFIISCIGGILQHFRILKGNFGYIYPWFERINGFFSNFNSFGIAISLFLPILFYYVFKTKSFVYRMIFIILIIFCTISLLLSGTRSAAVSVIINLFLIVSVFIIYSKKPLITFLKFLISIFVFLFFVFLISKIFHNPGLRRILTTDINSDLNIRKIYWSTAIDMFLSNVLVGHGIKSYYINFYNFTKKEALSDNACNTYLHYLAEIGILGFLVFLAVIYIIFRSFFYYLIQRKYFEIIISLSLISFLIVSIFGHHLDSEEISILFWLLLSLICVKDKKEFKLIKYFLSSLILIFFVTSIYYNYNKLRSFDIFKYRNYAGIYEKEKFEEKEGYWTDKYAIFNIKGFNKKKIIFEVNRVIKKEQEVAVFLDNKLYDKIILDKDRWEKIEIPLDQYKFSTLKIVPKVVFYEAGILRYIFPFIGKDYRRRGIVLNFYETE
ncbi:MAG: O-antigen ligase family protein [Elusimicrobiota bacterium]|nr:O-antigen ligase family protein [Endomicrobiia bacterium]MDW8165595.1 O-antigen ligase family protein [Elusimicrobiota bacterium]